MINNNIAKVIITLIPRGNGRRDGKDEATRRSCCRHLGSYSPLALKFRLVPLKGLLSTVLELVAVVVLWQTVLGEEGMSCTITRKSTGDVPHRRIRLDSEDIDQRCGELQSCRVFQLGVGNASWGP